MDDATNAALVIAPITMALTEAAKQTGYLPPRLAVVTTLILGVAAAFLFLTTGDVRTHIEVGIISGLSASGLYSGGKALAGK